VAQQQGAGSFIFGNQLGPYQVSNVPSEEREMEDANGSEEIDEVAPIFG
jgi:hypothetical protein